MFLGTTTTKRTVASTNQVIPTLMEGGTGGQVFPSSKVCLLSRQPVWNMIEKEWVNLLYDFTRLIESIRCVPDFSLS